MAYIWSVRYKALWDSGQLGPERVTDSNIADKCPHKESALGLPGQTVSASRCLTITARVQHLSSILTTSFLWKVLDLDFFAVELSKKFSKLPVGHRAILLGNYVESLAVWATSGVEAPEFLMKCFVDLNGTSSD